MNGAGGNDYLVGRDGNDSIDGGAGYDGIQGDDGDDHLYGGDDGDWGDDDGWEEFSTLSTGTKAIGGSRRVYVAL